MERAIKIQNVIKDTPVGKTVSSNLINAHYSRTRVVLDRMHCLEREGKKGKFHLWKRTFDPIEDLPEPRGEVPFTRDLSSRCTGCYYAKSETGCTIRNENYWNKLEF